MKVIRQLLARFHTPVLKQRKGKPVIGLTPLRLTERHFPSLVPSTEKRKSAMRKWFICTNTKLGKRKRKESSDLSALWCRALFRDIFRRCSKIWGVLCIYSVYYNIPWISWHLDSLEGTSNNSGEWLYKIICSLYLAKILVHGETSSILLFFMDTKPCMCIKSPSLFCLQESTFRSLSSVSNLYQI